MHLKTSVVQPGWLAHSVIVAHGQPGQHVLVHLLPATYHMLAEPTAGVETPRYTPLRLVEGEEGPRLRAAHTDVRAGSSNTSQFIELHTAEHNRNAPTNNNNHIAHIKAGSWHNLSAHNLLVQPIKSRGRKGGGRC